MLAELINFVKKNQNDIILIIGVILISLFSFAMGYIVARQGNKEPLKIKQFLAPINTTEDLTIDH